MAGFLPNVNVVAVATTDGAAVATLQPVVYARKLAGLTITGAIGSRCNVYIGFRTPSARIDQTARGQSNSADYATPRIIPPGQAVIVEWPGQAANATQSQATFTFGE